MSSSKDNKTFKKTSFLAGNNAEFIQQFYADYLSDPNSLPLSWRQFFEGLSDEQKLIHNDLKGPSWSPERKLRDFPINLNVEEKELKPAEINFDSIKEATKEIGENKQKKNNKNLRP